MKKNLFVLKNMNRGIEQKKKINVGQLKKLQKSKGYIKIINICSFLTVKDFVSI